MSDTTFQMDHVGPARQDPAHRAGGVPLASGWFLLPFALLGLIAWYWIIVGILAISN